MFGNYFNLCTALSPGEAIDAGEQQFCINVSYI